MADVQQALQSIMSVLVSEHETPQAHLAARPVICISRDFGSGGDDIARRLADRLEIPVYDPQILDKIAQRLDTDTETLRALEAGTTPVRDLWLYSRISGKGVDLADYRQHLISVLLSLGRSGGIILGRGGHLVLAQSGALRLRLTGSVEVCATRIAASEALGIQAARERVISENAKRENFVKQTFGVSLNEPGTFDLTVNTDRFEDKDALVDLLLDARHVIARQANA